MALLELKDAALNVEITTPTGKSIYDPRYAELMQALNYVNEKVSFEKDPAVGLALLQVNGTTWSLALDFANGRAWNETLKRVDAEITESFTVTGDWFLAELERMRPLRMALKSVITEWTPSQIEIRWL